MRLKRYIQTWQYVARLNRHLPWIARLIQWLCGLRGHEISKTEHGYGGGKYADCWCRWCNKHLQIPKAESPFAQEFGGLVGGSQHLKDLEERDEL